MLKIGDRVRVLEDLYNGSICVANKGDIITIPVVDHYNLSHNIFKENKIAISVGTGLHSLSKFELVSEKSSESDELMTVDELNDRSKKDEKLKKLSLQWVKEDASESVSAFDTQTGGSHYKDLKIEPVEYALANKLDFAQGSIIKYVTRFRNKNGIEDLRKAIHCIELLIEFEERK